MIDTFALLVSHVVLLAALLRLVQRDDLDKDQAPEGSSAAPGKKAPHG